MKGSVSREEAYPRDPGLSNTRQAFAPAMLDNHGAVDLEGPLVTVPLVTIPLTTVPLAILYTEVPSLFIPKS